MSKLLSGKRFHLVGIKGVAMTALSLILKDLGKEVSGSDLEANFQTQSILKNAGLAVYNQFDPAHVENADVVVYSAAHEGSQNPEVVRAVELKIPVCSFPKIVGELSLLKPTVAVCGCHGKTTTSSLISYLAYRAKLAPSYFVGVSLFMGFPGGAWGNGDLFVTEADEYLTDPITDRRSKFLYYNPQYIVCTNLDYDHPDFFQSPLEVSEAYLAFFKKIPDSGFLLLNGDDTELVKLGRKSQKPVFTYGFKNSNNYHLELSSNGVKVNFEQKLLAELTPRLIGRHNYQNLGASIAFLNQFGVKPKAMIEAANEFKGASRRLEKLYAVGANLVIDDYAHHPAEIHASIEALRKNYPDHRIALCFQPHTFSRTRALYKDFLKVLREPDFLGLLPIFASAREPFDSSISSQKLLLDLNWEQGSLYLDSDSLFVRLVKITQSLYPKWIYLTMGAGDVYKRATIIKEAL